MTTEEVVRFLELAAYKIWDCVLVGNQCQKVSETYEEMKNPKPGDLVIETTTLIGAKIKGQNGLEPRGICGVGWLVRIAQEPIYTAEVWKSLGEPEEEPIPTEKVYYLKLFDGREFRWVNADFLKIPISTSPHATK